MSTELIADYQPPRTKDEIRLFYESPIWPTYSRLLARWTELGMALADAGHREDEEGNPLPPSSDASASLAEYKALTAELNELRTLMRNEYYDLRTAQVRAAAQVEELRARLEREA